MNAQEEGSRSQEDFPDNCEQLFAAALDFVGQFVVMDADSGAVLDTGSTVNLVRFKSLAGAIIRLRRGRALHVRGPIPRGRDSNLVTVARERCATQ